MRRMAWLLVLVAGCGTASAGGDTFVLHDGSIDGPDTLAAGATSLAINNVGNFNHTLLVTDVAGNVVAATEVVASGEETVLSVRLTEGTYQVSCRLVTQDPEGNIIDHYELGMHHQLEVEG